MDSNNLYLGHPRARSQASAPEVISQIVLLRTTMDQTLDSPRESISTTGEDGTPIMTVSSLSLEAHTEQATIATSPQQPWTPEQYRRLADQTAQGASQIVAEHPAMVASLQVALHFLDQLKEKTSSETYTELLRQVGDFQSGRYEYLEIVKIRK